MRDYLGETPLHSFRVHADTVNYLTSSLTNEQWYSLLQVTDRSSRTPVHHAAKIGNTETVSALTHSLTNEQWFSLLHITDDNGIIPVHCAADGGSNKTVSCLTNTLTNEQWYSLLMTKDKYNITPAHAAACGVHGHDMLSALRETVTPEQWIDLLSIPLPNIIYRHDFINRIISESSTVRNILENKPSSMLKLVRWILQWIRLRTYSDGKQS